MADTTPSNLPSEAVLDAVAVRAFQFIKAVSNNPSIRAALAQRGYNATIHREAWENVIKAAGFGKTPDAPLAKPEEAAALATIDAWDEPNFEIAEVALAPMPEQQAYLFNNISAQKGPPSVGVVEIFLARLNNMETGKDRPKASRKKDQEAVAKLALRGIDEAERKRLSGLIEVAKGLGEVVTGDTSKIDAEKKEQREAKIATWYYFNEWSTIAKRVITRRDYLIQLGLAKRKKGSGGEAPSGGGEGAGGGETPGGNK